MPMINVSTAPTPPALGRSSNVINKGYINSEYGDLIGLGGSIPSDPDSISIAGQNRLGRYLFLKGEWKVNSPVANVVAKSNPVTQKRSGMSDFQAQQYAKQYDLLQGKTASTPTTVASNFVDSLGQGISFAPKSSTPIISYSGIPANSMLLTSNVPSAGSAVTKIVNAITNPIQTKASSSSSSTFANVVKANIPSGGGSSSTSRVVYDKPSGGITKVTKITISGTPTGKW